MLGGSHSPPLTCSLPVPFVSDVFWLLLFGLLLLPIWPKPPLPPCKFNADFGRSQSLGPVEIVFFFNIFFLSLDSCGYRVLKVLWDRQKKMFIWTVKISNWWEKFQSTEEGKGNDFNIISEWCVIFYFFFLSFTYENHDWLVIHVP